MMTENLQRFFQSTGLVDASTAEEIAGHFRPRSVPKNDFFLSEGKICHEYLFLEGGVMRAFAHNTEGMDITTSFFMPGTVVFEVSSFFQRKPSRENIQALTDCHGWFVTFEELNGLFHSMPQFREFGRSVLVRGFAALKERMLSLITESAEERYAKLMAAKPEVFRYVPLKHIASYLGITDTSLSRIRKEYSKK
jgi:CRP-like cAMP-binding protein